MMYGRGKSSPVIVARKPANKAEPNSVAAAESVERRAGAKGNADQRPRTGLSAGNAWYWCWRACVKLLCLIVSTRGGNRMRESCTSGSVRGARGNSRPYRARRREFITLLGGAAAWPLAARAQPGERVRRIGVLVSVDENDPEGNRRYSAFTQALADLGWTEGRNMRMDLRWGRGDINR